MTREEFIEALKSQTSDAAVSGTIKILEKPPGRSPHPRRVTLSNWYSGLSDADRAMLKLALKSAAELAVFSFLGVLDGVSVIENGPNRGTLKLLYVKGEEKILNDPTDEYLHDLYNGLCQQD